MSLKTSKKKGGVSAANSSESTVAPALDREDKLLASALQGEPDPELRKLLDSADISAGPVHETSEVSAASAVDDDANADDMDNADVSLEGNIATVAPITNIQGDSLLVKYLHPIAQEMSMLRATSDSAGLDLCACKDNCQRVVKLVPGSVESIPTGVAVAIPHGYCGLVFIRSGKNVKEGLQLSGGAYVIDSDFRGEIMLPLTSNKDYGTIVQPGERVAQLVIVPVVQFPISVVDELPETERGANGFGSTGK